MKKFLIMMNLLLIISLCHATKYAGEIFQLGAGVRNFALGNVGLTDENTSAAAYWNPSLLSKSDKMNIEIMHDEEFSGLMKYDTISATFGNSNRYSFVLSRIGIDKNARTKLNDYTQGVSEDNQPYVSEYFTNSDYIMYFGIMRTFFNKIDMGFSPKIAYRSLAGNSGYGFGLDISSHKKISSKLLLGIKIRDLIPTQIIWENGTHENVTPSLDLETRYSLNFPIINKKSNLYFRMESFSENRDYSSTLHLNNQFSADFHTGLEIKFNKYLNIYSGYDVDNFTAGLSVKINKYNINYGFKQNTELDNCHRISIGIKL